MSEIIEFEGRFFERTGKRVNIVENGQWYMTEIVEPFRPAQLTRWEPRK